jgi:hypothetical protein
MYFAEDSEKKNKKEKNYYISKSSDNCTRYSCLAQFLVSGILIVEISWSWGYVADFIDP